MSRRQLDQTLELIAALDRARSAPAICDFILRAAARFGAEHVLAGTVPMPGADRRAQRAHVVLEHWPAGWVNRYFSRGYLDQDPAIRRVLRAAPPFEWRELSSEDPAERRVMEEAGDFRLREGFTVPLMTLEGDAAGFSFAGEKIELAPQDRGVLSLVATYALARALSLREFPPGVKLTPREREALQWSAEGKSEWEIGEIMGISEHGAHKHLRSVRRKLGVSSKTHAAAMGIRLGLIV